MERPYIRAVRLYQHLGTVRKLFRQLFFEMSHLRGGRTCDIRRPKNEIFKIAPKLKIWTSGVEFWLTFEVKLRKKIRPPSWPAALGLRGLGQCTVRGLSDFQGRGAKKVEKSVQNR